MESPETESPVVIAFEGSLLKTWFQGADGYLQCLLNVPQGSGPVAPAAD